MDKEKKEYRYVQFPLCLLKETYRDRDDGLNLIMDFGIMNYASKLKYDIEDVAKQTLYDYERDRNKLHPYLTGKLSDAIDEGAILYEEGNPGFIATSKYEPEPDLCLNPLKKMLDSDSRLWEQAVINYRLHIATSKKHLNIRILSNPDMEEQYLRGKKIQSDFEQKYGPDAMPFCKYDILQKFKSNHGEDMDLLRAYIGIKSMIGYRNFISCNKPAALSRMVGLKSKAAFEYYTTNRYNKDSFILPTVEKYRKRYHMDKLLMRLVEQKFIMFLTEKNVSVIYVSKYMEPEELAKLVKQSHFRYDIKKRIRAAAATLNNN